MKKLFLFFISSLFLNGCTTPKKEYVFIDSNVSADVYTGDKKIGETPFYETLSGNEIEHLSVRKKGYKTVMLKTSSVRLKEKYTRGGLFAVSQISSSSTSGCEKIPVSLLNQDNKNKNKNQNESNLCAVNSVYVLMTTAYGLGITTVLADTFYVPSYAFEYEDNEYYVEMVPDGKNKLSQADKQYFRRNLFILKNFAMLQVENKEYVEALNALSENKPVLSAMKYIRATDYLRTINQRK